MKLEEFLRKEQITKEDVQALANSIQDRNIIVNYVKQNIRKSETPLLKKEYVKIFNQRESLEIYKCENMDHPTEKDNAVLTALALRVYLFKEDEISKQETRVIEL